ncbi:hypothetical protein ACQVP2_28530 [Methylobacterium aquaticum]|uniref:Pam3-gp28 family putative phage holin n=1 Tax=Methylobacterium aquaticum TaxID=270351 RepID=UPI003D1747F3
MNVEQAGSLARTVVQLAAAYAVGRGWLDQSTAAEVGAALVTLAVTAYGVYVRRDEALKAAGDKAAAKAAG